MYTCVLCVMHSVYACGTGLRVCCVCGTAGEVPHSVQKRHEQEEEEAEQVQARSHTHHHHLQEGLLSGTAQSEYMYMYMWVRVPPEAVFSLPLVCCVALPCLFV